MTHDASAYPPIGSYGLLSDCHSAALVSLDGSVDWCCFHRFDSRPVFARIIDWRKGGHFQIRIANRMSSSRSYIDGTNVLRTTMTGPDGVLEVTDCLPVSVVPEGTVPQPYRQLVRLAECIEGSVDVEVLFAPRFDYGRTIPQLELIGEHVAVVTGGPDALVLQSEAGLVSELDDGFASLRLSAGERVRFLLTHHLPHLTNTTMVPWGEVEKRISETIRFWKDWTAKCTYSGPYEGLVRRSALVLKALTNAPSGAIAAAITTSLPEEIGGVRNWDYRYNWLRDATLNLFALFKLGYRGEAEDFMHWLRRTTAGRADDLQIMYGLGGERLLPEWELDWLEGYRGSRPVRIGNAAVDQFQLDVYGYLLDTAWQYHKHGGEFDPRYQDFLAGVVDVVCRSWNRPDQGIWEMRKEPSHFVSSKVMAWVALDRGLRLFKAEKIHGDSRKWSQAALDVRSAIESQGVDQSSGVFVQAFGSRDLDASNLLIPLVKFLPPTDPRVKATLERSLEELAPDGYCYRYLTEDGLPGGEGVFVICSFWLASNLALAGRVAEAQEIFERVIKHSNDLGLLSEEFDPTSGQLLGNFPQAFSHVGLISAALNIKRASEPDRT